MPRTGKDLTGQKFGKLIVLGFGGYKQNARQRVSLWDCYCDCGKTCKIEGYLLTSGRRKSCGCIRQTADKMIGQRYGKLVVIKEDTDNQTTQKKAICRCDCGSIKSIVLRNLKNGKVKSCGCDDSVKKNRTDFQSRQYDEELESLRKNFRQGNLTQIHTIREWAYVWLREVLESVVKPTTIHMYAETMEHHVFPLLGEQLLSELSGEQLDIWLEKLSRLSVKGTRNGQMTDGTVKNIFSILSGSLRDAQKYGLINNNPCSTVTFFNKINKEQEGVVWLTKEQIRYLEPAMASYKSEDGYPIGIGFQLVLYTGITLSEAAALQWCDVDFQQSELRIEKFVAVNKGLEETEEYGLEKLSGRRNRVVPVPDFLMNNLKELKDIYHGKEDDFVLKIQNNNPVRMDRMRIALQRRSRMCGMEVDVTPRILRDTYAMRAVQAGATSDMIAELMGYSSPHQVIRRYMPTCETDKRELLKRMFAE